MGEDERNPFKRKNVVAAMLGYEGETLAPEPKPDLPTAVDVLERDMAAKERQAKLRKMKPWERRRYERDRQRVKVSLTLPRPLLGQIMEISRQEIVPPSSVAEWLIAEGSRRWKSGEVPPPEVTRPRNLRVKVSLVLPSQWEGERESRTFDLPHVLENVYELAKHYGCGRSDAAAWLMSVGLVAFQSGVFPDKERSNDMRFAFRFKLPRKSNKAMSSEKPVSPVDVVRRLTNE